MAYVLIAWIGMAYIAMANDLLCCNSESCTHREPPTAHCAHKNLTGAITLEAQVESRSIPGLDPGSRSGLDPGSPSRVSIPGLHPGSRSWVSIPYLHRVSIPPRHLYPGSPSQVTNVGLDDIVFSMR